MNGRVVFSLTDAQVAVLFDADALRAPRSERAWRSLEARGLVAWGELLGTSERPPERIGRLTVRGDAVVAMLRTLGFRSEP